jgi:hypothetical protein
LKCDKFSSSGLSTDWLKCDNFSSSCQSADNGRSVITSVLVVSQQKMVEV